MADDLQLLRRYVLALARRERTLLVCRVLLQSLLLLAGLLGVLLGGAVAGWDRPTTAFLVVLGGGVGIWFALCLPLLRRWGPSGDPLEQARRVEALDESLRGRLITAVERVDGPRRGESPELLALVARRATTAVERLAVHVVHPTRSLRRLAGSVAAVWLVVVASSMLIPGGVGGMLHWWTAGTRAEAAVADVVTQLPQDFARVGDLVLRYTYPAYTGLDPREIPNSTGDVSGPPGTLVEVTARTGDPVQAAGLVAYDERLEAAISEDGRQVGGRFSIGLEEGRYHLMLYRGVEPERSRDFTIAVEPDLPPDVTLDGPDVLEVPVDGTIPIAWRARDDYGVAKVVLQVAGQAIDTPFFVAERRQAEAFGQHTTSPRRLGLEPGDEVELTVAAFDNDTVSGSKAGLSRPVRLVVLGARGIDARIALREAELIEVLVPILAAHLTDRWPPGDTSDEMARWGSVVARRYQPLHDAIDRLWQGMASDTHDTAVVSRVVDSGSQLVRYTQVAFTPGATERPGQEAWAATSELREEAIVAIEDALIFLTRMQEGRALRELAEQAEGLARMASDIGAMLDEDEPEPHGILAQLDHLERMLERVSQQAARLSDGGLKEYVNQRTSELNRLMDEVRSAIAEGNLDRARELMSRLQRQVHELAQGIRDELDRRMRNSESAGEAIEELREQLKALEEEQRKLHAEVSQLQEQSDRDGRQQMEQLWQRLDALAAEAVSNGAAYRDAIDAEGDDEAARWSFNERQRADEAVRQTIDLQESIKLRDIRGALSAAADADAGWMYTERAADSRRAREAAGPRSSELSAIRSSITQIERLLEQVDEASRSVDPASRRRAQQLQQRQIDLEQRMREATDSARQLSRQLPVRPQGMDEALQDGRQRMQHAADDLGRGRPMQAEGSQAMAADRLREAQDALDRALEQMRQQQQQMRRGQRGEDSGQQRDRGERDNQPFTSMEIPGREEFQTPEEYRRALLEGMEGDVPEEYRSLKKRYYEELVHQ